MLKQRSQSPLYHNQEDYLNPKKPQQTNQLPQFSKYQKENIQQPQLMQTVRKKPLIFDNRPCIQFNVSPLRMDQVQFKVSQPRSRSPMIRKTNEIQNFPNQQVMMFQVHNSSTPQKKQIVGQVQQIQIVSRPQVQFCEQQKINLTELQEKTEYVVQNRQNESSNSIYSYLQDELAKSEMKLKILTERSQQIQEQRMQLRYAYKNQNQKSVQKQ